MARVLTEPITDHVGIETAVEMIDPRTAQEWLEGNVRNRKMREDVVKFYAAEMKAGRWRFTGEAIQFSTNGELLNGQHRLNALIQSAMTLPFLVVRNLPPEAQVNMDGGAKRTVSDALGLLGEKNATTLAAGARVAIQMERAAAVGLPPTFGGQVSPGEIVEWLANNGDMRHAAELGAKYKATTDAPSGAVLTYTTWRTWRINPYETERFLIDMSEKVGLQRHDPALTLTKRFADLRRNRERLPKAEQISMTFRAWNARRKNETLAIIRQRIEGRPIPIPEPI